MEIRHLRSPTTARELEQALGGVTRLDGLYGYVGPQRVGFFSGFGRK